MLVRNSKTLGRMDEIAFKSRSATCASNNLRRTNQLPGSVVRKALSYLQRVSPAFMIVAGSYVVFLAHDRWAVAK